MPAAYILGMVIGVPLLLSWDILPIAAHLFVMFYAVLGAITPPVCAAVFVAAHIAQSDWLKSGGIAVKLAPVLYIVPFIFVLNPTLILRDALGEILLNVSTALVGTIALASGIGGYLITRVNIFERLLVAASGFLLLLPGLQTDLLAAVVVAAIVVKQLFFRRQQDKPSGELF